MPERKPAVRGIAALSLLAAVSACTTSSHPEPEPTSRAPSSASSAPPACSPRVLESGFNRSGADFWFGYIVENPCDQAAVQNYVVVQPMTASGNPVGQPKDVLPGLPVLLPGQRIGIGGLVHLTQDPQTVASLSFKVQDNDLVPATTFAAWPRSVTARNITHDAADAGGTVPLTFDVVTDPPNAPLCQPTAQIIARDKAGHIVYGTFERITGPTVSLSVKLPASADLTKTEIYVEQGQYVFGKDLKGVACGTAP